MASVRWWAVRFLGLVACGPSHLTRVVVPLQGNPVGEAEAESCTLECRRHLNYERCLAACPGAMVLAGRCSASEAPPVAVCRATSGPVSDRISSMSSVPPSENMSGGEGSGEGGSEGSSAVASAALGVAGLLLDAATSPKRDTHPTRSREDLPPPITPPPPPPARTTYEAPARTRAEPARSSRSEHTPASPSRGDKADRDKKK